VAGKMQIITFQFESFSQAHVSLAIHSSVVYCSTWDVLNMTHNLLPKFTSDFLAT